MVAQTGLTGRRVERWGLYLSPTAPRLLVHFGFGLGICGRNSSPDRSRTIVGSR